MRLLARAGLMLTAAVVAAFAMAPSAAATATAEADLGLNLAVLSADAVTGASVAEAEIPIELTIVNRSSTPCQIAALANGTVRVTGVMRDGRAVTPTFGEVRYVSSLTQQAENSLQMLQPGREAKLLMTVVKEGEVRTLSTVDALPGSGGVTSNWAMQTPGQYRISAVYSTPQSIGQAPCRGTSDVATVEFTTGGSPTADEPIAWWWIAAAVVALVGLSVLVWLLRRGHRGRGGVAAALVLACLVTGLVVGNPPARAEVSVGGAPNEFIGTQLALGGCMKIFNSPGGDPAGLLPVVNAKPGPNIKVRPRRSGDKTDSHVVGKDGNEVIYWDHDDKKTMLDPGGLTPSHPGTLTDPCAELYHELAHAKDYNTSAAPKHTDKRPCDHLFIETTEAAATLAENQYRASRKLDRRRTYSGFTLPKSIKDCEDRPPESQKQPTQCTPSAEHAGGAPSGCDEEVPPEPDRGRPGMSNGDPHLITLDGRPYDFQAVGEFVAVESADGDLVVQTRQAPVPGSRSLSLNTAVAFKIGQDKLQFAVVDGNLALWVNGKPENWARGARLLPGGGKSARRPSPITFNQDGYTVRWPDGSQAWVDIVGNWGLRLYVLVADSRKGTVHGLLGDFDGEPDNDLRPRGGQPLTELTPEALYETYGNSWRVSPSESLFVYNAGETTKTFTDSTFPDKLIDVPQVDPAQRDTARAICDIVGITDPVQLNACILDVALTGQPAFAVNTLDIQANPVLAGPPDGTTEPEPPSGAVRDGDSVSGEVTVAGQAQRYTLDLGGATDFFVTDWRGKSNACDQTFSVNLVDVSSGNQPCTGGSVRFQIPDTAKSYQLEIASKPGQLGSFQFRLVTVKRRTFTVALGDRVTGAIDVRGREDAHQFEPSGATQVRLTGLPADCSANITIDLFDVTENRTVAADRALCGESVPFTLDNPAHQHAIVVSSTNVGTGPYTFTLQRE